MCVLRVGCVLFPTTIAPGSVCYVLHWVTKGGGSWVALGGSVEDQLPAESQRRAKLAQLPGWQDGTRQGNYSVATP